VSDLATSPPVVGFAEDDDARPRLSPVRVAIAVVLVAAAAGGGALTVRNRLTASAAPTGGTWFAPYVDATLTPTYAFQNPADSTARQVVLGFVVSQPGAPCAPSWGATGSLSDADQTIALGSRVAELSQEGATAIVSFGGKAHTDLAAGCADAAGLTRAYQSVIDAYRLHVIDLDIEGAALDDFPAQQRRVAAIAAIEAAARDHHQPLSVWLTLPVEPTGLQDNAISVIDSMLAGHVSLAGVDVMAMDFATPPPVGQSMLAQVEQAASAAQHQVADQFRRYGVKLLSAQTWQRIGVTVMIGQNDIAGERFTVADAQGLAAFATRTGLGRISMWSLNRDRQCGSAFAQVGVSSNLCSGTPQATLAFSHEFGQFNGTATAAAASVTAPPPAVTDPANAPYPLWSPTAPYPAGYKVVRQGYVYEAKWYNSGEDPVTQVQYSWQSPWDLLGPVLPTDRAPTPVTTPGSDYPLWSTATRYVTGDRVTYQGLPFSAKWPNQGASPGGAAGDPFGSPWHPLYVIPGEPATPSAQ
jgi:chitinase